MSARLSDPSAIRANTIGEITPDQRDALLEMVDEFVGAALLVGAVVFFGYLILTGPYFDSQPLLLLIVFPLVLVTAISAGMIWNRFVNARYRQRLSAPHPIESQTGQIRFQRGRYVAGHRLRQLRSIYGNINLEPGRYQFYRLRGTRWLLSAEPLAIDPTAAAEVDMVLARTLARANRFWFPALQANRQGRISVMQAFGLLRGGIFGLVSGLLFSVVMAVVATFMVPYLLEEVTGSLPDVMVAAGLTIYIVLLVVVWTLWRFLRRLFDLFSGQVQVYEGTIRRTSDPSGEGDPVYFYEFDGKSFGVPKKAYNALIVNRRYRAYYAPRSKRLLNIEPLAAQPDESQAVYAGRSATNASIAGPTSA